MPLILGTNSIKDTGYDVANSLRFNDDSSDYLNRTPSGAGNRKTWTYSTWVKRGNLVDGRLTSCYSASNDNDNIDILFSSNAIRIVGWNTAWRVTNRLFRDVSAWYHIVVAVDTTQGTANDRIKVYVNGVQETSFSTTNNPSQNADIGYNQAAVHRIGSASNSVGGIFDGYMAEVAFIDSSQLAPDQFGEFDEDSGIWKPINVSGLTFGTNGFYLDFENSGSLGADVSGNGNNFTANNLTAIDSVSDVPTNNFATFNSLSKNDAGTVTFSDGNLKTAHSGTDSRYSAYSTIGVSQGKWYAEFKYEATSGGSDVMFGIGSDIENTNRTGGNLYSSATGYVYWSNDGSKGNNDSTSPYGNSFAVGDIIGIALDLDNYKLYFSKNGVWQNSGDPTSGATGTGSAFNLTSGETYFFAGTHATSTSRTSTYSANFGNAPYTISSGNTDGNGYGNFEYAVPSGYYALNTKNLAEYG